MRRCHFRAKPEAKARNLWNLQDLSKRCHDPFDFAQGKLSLDMTQRESSWWSLVDAGLKPGAPRHAQ